MAVEDKGGVWKDCHVNEDSQDTGGLVIVKPRLFFPSNEVLTWTVGSFPEECYIPPMTHVLFSELQKKFNFIYISLCLSLPQFYGGEGDVRA